MKRFNQGALKNSEKSGKDFQSLEKALTALREYQKSFDRS